MTDPAADCRHPSRLAAWLRAVALALLPLIGNAAPGPAVFGDATEKVDLGPYAEFLEDPGAA